MSGMVARKVKISTRLALIEKPDLLFYLMWGIYSFGYFIMIQSDFSVQFSLTKVFYIVEILCAAVLCYKVLFFDKISKKEIIGISVIFAIVIISLFLCRDHAFFMSCVFAVGINNIKFKDFIKFDIICKISATLVIILLCGIKVLEDYTMTSGGVTRHSFGFNHPNTLGTMLGAILIEYVYLKYEYFNKKSYIVFILGLAAMFIITRTRTTFIALLFVFLIFIVFREKISAILEKKILHVILPLTPTILALFSIVTGLCYNADNKLFYAINRVFSGRIYFAWKYFKREGISLFGQKIKLVSSRYKNPGDQNYVLDNAYAKIAIMFGLLVMILLCVGYWILIRKLMIQKRYDVLAIVFLYLIVGLMENSLLRPAYNVSLLLLIYYDKIYNTWEKQVPLIECDSV